MNQSAILVLAVVLLSSATSSAHAFDGKREGFQIGIGIGAHASQIGFQEAVSQDPVELDKQLAMSFQIGYGFSNRIVGYFGIKSGAVVINGLEGNVGIGGFGATFYLSETSPSLYVTGLFGSGSLTLTENDQDYTDSGTGWMAGIGYEITDRLHLELSHARADLVDPDNDLNNAFLQSSFVTMNYVWY